MTALRQSAGIENRGATATAPVRLAFNHKQEERMKHFDCIVPGCTWHTEAEEVAEVVRRAADHLRTTHDEAEIRPSMVEHIKERIVEAEPAR